MTPPPTPQTPHVYGYAPEWRHHAIDLKSLCQHGLHTIIWFSLEIEPTTGKLNELGRLPKKDLRDEANKYCKQQLVCIGGNGRSAGFAPALRSPKKRRTLLKHLSHLLDKHGYDGVDLNWEYPGYSLQRGSYSADDLVEAEYTALRAFVVEAAAALHPRVLTLAYYPDGRQEAQLAPIASHLAAMHAMVYDAPHRHSTYDFAVRAARQAAALLPARKVTLGVPFYGRHMTTGEWRTYEDLTKLAEVRRNTSVDEADGYYFNNRAVMARKGALARELGLGGVMIWEVGQDCRIAPVTRGGATHARTCACSAAGDREAEVAAPPAADGACYRSSLVHALSTGLAGEGGEAVPDPDGIRPGSADDEPGSTEPKDEV